MAKLILWLIMPLYMWGVTITEDTTLSEDVVYNEDVVVNGAILKLNNHTLTVNGDLNITGANARLQMTKSQDKLIVKGDLTFAGASTYQDLTSGVIELAGNFYQKGTETEYYYHSTKDGTNVNQRYRANNAFSFYPTDNHKVILNGTSKQIIDFEAPNNSRFNHLEIQNSSSDAIVFKQLNVVGEWKRNGNQVKITDIRNWTLTEDYAISNDVDVIGGILNLNGHILTINGNLKFSSSYCRLQMKRADDKLIVKGDLTFAGASTYQDLTSGVIELAGDFYQKGTETEYYYHSTKDGTNVNQRYRANNAFSFYPTDNHKVILNGTSKQIIDFEAPSNSRFNHLEIQNSSSDGVVFEELNVVGEWKRNNNSVTITDIRNLTLTEDYTIPNDVDVIGGILNLNGYALTINGNLKFSSSYCRLQMKRADDKLIVKGDLTFAGASTYQDLTNGVIELAGNFYQKGTKTEYYYHSTKDGTNMNQRYRANNAYSFYPTENHKLILNGDSIQRVSFEAPDSSRFMNLEITNDNVIFDLESGKKAHVIGDIYLPLSLYNSTYKNHELLTYNRYRDINKVYMELARGLHLTSLPVKNSLNEEQIKSIFSDANVSYVLKYDVDNSQWQGFSNNALYNKKIQENKVAKLTTINAGEGIFINVEGDVELKFPRDDGYKLFDKVEVSNLASGWHLLGSNKLIKIDELLSKQPNIKVIWTYLNAKWYYFSNQKELKEEYKRRDIPAFEDINSTNSGFWVYVE